jgi:copper chaperone CopZ
MKHTYTISGMRCDGCRKNVEKALNGVDGVQAKVELNPPLATITMHTHIPTEKLQKALTEVGIIPYPLARRVSAHIRMENQLSNTNQKNIPTLMRRIQVRLENTIALCIVRVIKCMISQGIAPYAACALLSFQRLS